MNLCSAHIVWTYTKHIYLKKRESSSETKTERWDKWTQKNWCRTSCFFPTWFGFFFVPFRFRHQKIISQLFNIGHLAATLDGCAVKKFLGPEKKYEIWNYIEINKFDAMHEEKERIYISVIFLKIPFARKLKVKKKIVVHEVRLQLKIIMDEFLRSASEK